MKDFNFFGLLALVLLGTLAAMHACSAGGSDGGTATVTFTNTGTQVVNPLIVHLPLEGVVDLSAEQERLRAELDDCLKNMDRVEKLVSNPNFLEKAKPEVVETEQARLQDLKERQQHLNEILEQLAG